jgi:hypothetical protein
LYLLSLVVELNPSFVRRYSATTSISPKDGAIQGGTAVTIGLSAAFPQAVAQYQCFFGTTPAAVVSVTSQSITCTAPASVVGTTPVTVKFEEQVYITEQVFEYYGSCDSLFRFTRRV